MGIFSRSPRNVKRNKVAVMAPPSLPGQHKDNHVRNLKPTAEPLSRDELMFNALMKMAARRKFRAAVHSVQFLNLLNDRIESRRRTLRKLRASVRCINFVQLLEERQAARRKFRASVNAVELANSLTTGIEARRKFKAAVNVVILSDRLVDPPLHKSFGGLQAFQDSVNLILAVKRLETPFSNPTLQQEHNQMIRKNGMEQLNEAIGVVLNEEKRATAQENVIAKKQQQESSWSPTVLRGNLVHESRDFTTLWKFVEQDPTPANAE